MFVTDLLQSKTYVTPMQTSTSVPPLHARTEPLVWIKLEVIAVIAWQDTLEATVKQVSWTF